MEILSFDDVWIHRERLLATRIRVRGQFFSNETAYVATDFESCVAGRRMRLLDEGAIEKHLLNLIPAWGGGPFILNELIIVTGTIQRRVSEFEIGELADCVVTSSDGEITVDVSL